MNLRFVARGLLLGLPLAIVAATAGLILIKFYARIGPPPDPTPPPPAIAAPRGTMPEGRVSFQELARYRNEAFGGMVGCGFLLTPGEGQVVGVTPAHSISLGNAERPLDQIGFQLPNQPDLSLQFDTLHGWPGSPRTGQDMTVDHVLLRPQAEDLVSLDSGLFLTPDPRGGPQPGERVSLYKCMGKHPEQQILEGTVQSANDSAIWVLMDRRLSPDLMSGSGSPFISQHTGQVVGMLIAGTIRRDRVLLAAHPVGSLVDLADQASQFPTLSDYQETGSILD